MDTQADALLGAQRLCQACGLCCKGVWFSHVRLIEGEAEIAKKAGFNVHVQETQAEFDQPCPMHKNGCCSVYEAWRPMACKTYSCALLDAYAAGQVSEDVAQGHVRDARGMAERIQAETGYLVGGLKGEAFQLTLRPPTEGGSGEQLLLSPACRMDAVALTVYYERHFKKPKSDASSAGDAVQHPA